jgi:hypothetical protein
MKHVVRGFAGLACCAALNIGCAAETDPSPPPTDEHIGRATSALQARGSACSADSECESGCCSTEICRAHVYCDGAGGGAGGGGLYDSCTYLQKVSGGCIY